MTLRVYFNRSKPVGIRKNFRNQRRLDPRIQRRFSFVSGATLKMRKPVSTARNERGRRQSERRGKACRAPKAHRRGEGGGACRARRRNDNMVKPHGLLVLLG